MKLFAMLVCLVFSSIATATEFFPTRSDCERAVREGTAEFYSPRMKRPAKIAEIRASGEYLEDRLDKNSCSYGWVSYPKDGKGGSWQFIARKEGTVWFPKKGADGKPLNYGLMDGCANEEKDVIAVAPAEKSKPITAVTVCDFLDGRGPVVVARKEDCKVHVSLQQPPTPTGPRIQIRIPEPVHVVYVQEPVYHTPTYYPPPYYGGGLSINISGGRNEHGHSFRGPRQVVPVDPVGGGRVITNPTNPGSGRVTTNGSRFP